MDTLVDDINTDNCSRNFFKHFMVVFSDKRFSLYKCAKEATSLFVFCMNWGDIYYQDSEAGDATCDWNFETYSDISYLNSEEGGKDS